MSQCRYCETERGHDYMHPHVVRAVNELMIGSYRGKGEPEDG